MADILARHQDIIDLGGSTGKLAIQDKTALLQKSEVAGCSTDEYTFSVNNSSSYTDKQYVKKKDIVATKVEEKPSTTMTYYLYGIAVDCSAYLGKYTVPYIICKLYNFDSTEYQTYSYSDDYITPNSDGWYTRSWSACISIGTKTHTVGGRVSFFDAAVQEFLGSIIINYSQYEDVEVNSANASKYYCVKQSDTLTYAYVKYKMSSTGSISKI